MTNVSYSQVPTDYLFVFARAAVQTHAVERECHRRDAALVAGQLAQVSEGAVALRDEFYRVFPRACK